jgi:Na+-driven multidrug efflux pump
MSLAMGILDGVVFRIGLAILLGIVCDLGIWGFWLGSAIAGFAYCLLGCPYYLSGKWKTRKTLAES